MKLLVQLHRRGPHRRAGLPKAAATVTLAAVMGASWLPSVASAPTAAADQISTTRQQVGAAQAQVIAGARRVHQLTLAYAQANLAASSLQSQVASGQAQVARLEAATTQASARLKQEAIDSYTGAYTGVPSVVVSPRDSPLSDPAVRAGYVSLASGDLRDSLDSYVASQHELAQAQSRLAVREKQSVAAATTLRRARDAAIAQATSEQTRLDSLQVQLTNLENEQAAQQAAAQAAATAAAQQAAAQRAAQAARALQAMQAAQAAAAAAAAKARAAAAQAPSAGPPVDNGLVSVVQSVVSQPSTSSNTAPTSGDGGAGGVWLQLRECESGDNYQANTGNGYYGAYQFSQQTWTNLGFPGRPDLEPPSMQDQAAMELQSQSGWGQWPACSAALGLT